MKGHVETITQCDPGEQGPETETKDGATFRRERVETTHSGSKEIKYLGVHMNMDLNWDKQIAVMSSTIGMYRHLAIANNLSPQQTALLFNSYLKPKLEYRMQFTKITDEKLRNWDWQLTRTLSEKIENGNHIKGEAIKLCMGLRLPTEYYQETQLIQAMKKLNDDTDMGETTRTRMFWTADEYYKHENATYTQMMQGRRDGMILTINPERNRPIMQEPTVETKWITVEIQGKEHRLPEDHHGIWGNVEERIKAKIFTDGSVHQRKGEPRQAGEQ
jgi:hypothetical protein